MNSPRDNTYYNNKFQQKVLQHLETEFPKCKVEVADFSYWNIIMDTDGKYSKTYSIELKQRMNGADYVAIVWDANDMYDNEYSEEAEFETSFKDTDPFACIEQAARYIKQLHEV